MTTEDRRALALLVLQLAPRDRELQKKPNGIGYPGARFPRGHPDTPETIDGTPLGVPSIVRTCACGEWVL